MIGNDSFADVTRRLVEDPEYVKALTAQVKARTADPAFIERLVVYARARQATMGQAIARRVLTESGVSWEAL